MIFVRFIILVFIGTCLISCAPPEQKKQPNILWIFLEDTNPLLSSYGTTIISTPNIDRLAQNGIRFTKVFMSAPVCSASRSAIITGTSATTFGLHNHHSSRTEESAIHLPEGIRTIPELFREAGYFTFNNGKDDYNFSYNRKDLYDQEYDVHPLYGKRGDRLDLATLTTQPFFGQIQLHGGKEIFNDGFKEAVDDPVDRSAIVLPPYLPNDPVIIEEYANHLDAIQITDRKVGEIMEKLKNSHLLDNTIVFFFSDHGMRLTKHKQFLYDGGLHVPLIVAFYGEQAKLENEQVRDDLVSGIDIGTTSMALANIPIPVHMEGKDVFASNYIPREFVISTRDRCDFTIDRIRSVRSNDYKYIKNYMTDRPYTQATYMDFDSVPFIIRMKQLYTEGQLDSLQARFMSDVRLPEEFYDLKNDPYEMSNLANDSSYKDALLKHRAILESWIAKTDDKGQYPENKEGLKLMLGIWGEVATNPEYDILRNEYPDLPGSLIHYKTSKFEKKVQ